jgi:hypothetical protein
LGEDESHALVQGRKQQAVAPDEEAFHILPKAVKGHPIRHPLFGNEAEQLVPERTIPDDVQRPGSSGEIVSCKEIQKKGDSLDPGQASDEKQANLRGTSPQGSGIRSFRADLSEQALPLERELFPDETQGEGCLPE